MAKRTEHDAALFEKLKSALFAHGRDAVEEFLGYEIDPAEDKDVTDNRLDLAFQEMPAAILKTFYGKYLPRDDASNAGVTPENHPWVGLLAAHVATYMSDALENLRDDPSSQYDRGYHDALLDILEAFHVDPDPEYGERFD